MLYAQVIVDVPTMQTNRPYTYAVPEELVSLVHPGMRCVVPFGRGTRKVQGFIVALTEQMPSTEFQLKELESLMDLTPVLNEEGLKLADWMAEYTFSFKIACLQTMLPNLMRAGYEKKVKLLDLNVAPHLKQLFDQNQLLDFEVLTQNRQLQKEIAQLQKKGQATLIYQVKNRAKAKKVTYIKSKITPENKDMYAAKLRKNASKKQALLESLLKVTHPVLKTAFEKQNGFTAADLKQAYTAGWLDFSEQEAYRDPLAQSHIKPSLPKKLTAEQAQCVSQVTQALKQGSSQPFLLEGVTGSGKTEVYLQIIAHALAMGRQALMLVPEIALTPQIVQRVKSRFGNQVALLHSGLSAGERYDEWRRIEQGQASVVVGARSAIFAPLKKLGVIIMDEEHEASYKQDDMPRYHTRDVALWRSRYHHCPVVLGSATPSLESRARAQKGVYQGLFLTKRINGQTLPDVLLVDMREAAKRSPTPDFSLELLDKIKRHLARKEQVVLMLNRRGYSSFMMCRECGYVLKCPNCDISLTLHMDTHRMKCHYCGHEEAIPYVCAQCHSKKIKYYGTGTQKVQAQLAELLPEARVLRMDVDTTRKKGAHERILKAFGQKEADILLGTQMIAKGLDFPDVTLVGVLNADTSLSLPDFRSSEKTFQLLTQVSGRAGRANKAGEVVIQSYNPDNYAIQLACRHDYERFYAYEMQLRHQLGYPPYYFTIQLTASYDNEAQAKKKMYSLRAELEKVLSPKAIILGPTPQTVVKVNKRYYYQLVIKYKKEAQLEAYLKDLLLKSQAEERSGLKLVINRDPLSFM
ncbi:replication restart DNA helicase PriA [Ligilactobacillus sp. WC1T17]|uniref:Replication restart protein PriA n=1 Tax=Ligilactobacillus ruminis TaxID=1623 RepID=A0ABY1ABN3_9LACO|nr:replication restart DNA helicase PriA [Ligilactobacillus ruminis]